MAAASTQITDTTLIPPQSQHDIPFIIAAPGHVGVVSVLDPPPRKGSKTESGKPVRMQLIRPTHPPAVVETAPLLDGAHQMTMSYTASGADVAGAAKWICRIFNETSFPTQFATTLTIPPALTASFSVGLLDAMLALAARTADLRLHLQTSGDGTAASLASWSIPLANNLPKTPIVIDRSTNEAIVLHDVVEYRFNLPTLDAFSVHVPGFGDVTLADGELVNADSLFGLSLRLDGQDGIVASVAFDAPNIVLHVDVRDTPIGITDVQFQTFQVELTIDFDGRVTADAQVVASARLAGQTLDLGGPVRDKLLQRIVEHLPKQMDDAAAIKRGLFAFIGNLMRLNDVAIDRAHTRTLATGQILDVAFDGPALVASYMLVPSVQTAP